MRYNRAITTTHDLSCISVTGTDYIENNTFGFQFDCVGIQIFRYNGLK